MKEKATMIKKNDGTQSKKDTAKVELNNTSKPIKKQYKIEYFAELLLRGGLSGVSRWELIGKLKTSNAGSFANSLRKIGINITKGCVYTLTDIKSARAIVNFINEQRANRGAEPLCSDVVQYWLQPFANIENEGAG
jgi:hypothetical protein